MQVETCNEGPSQGTWVTQDSDPRSIVVMRLRLPGSAFLTIA